MCLTIWKSARGRAPYSDFRSWGEGRNQAGSLLLSPLVVSIRNSVSLAMSKSKLPRWSAVTTPMFHPGA